MPLSQRLLGQRGLIYLAFALVALVGVAALIRPVLPDLPGRGGDASETAEGPDEPDDPDAFTRWLTETRGVDDGGLPVNQYVEAERARR
jgi:hypothetical protein